MFELVVPAEGDPVDVAAVMPAKVSRGVLVADGASAGAVVAVAIRALVLVLSSVGSRPAARPSGTASSASAPSPTQVPVTRPPGWSAQAAWSVSSSAQPGPVGGGVAADALRVFLLAAVRESAQIDHRGRASQDVPACGAPSVTAGASDAPGAPGYDLPAGGVVQT